MRYNIKRYIEKAARSLEGDIWKFAKCENSIKKLENAMKVLGEVDAVGKKLYRYPAGIKAFVSLVELEVLDDLYPDSAERDIELRVTISRGSTIREAMKAFHHANTMFYREHTPKVQKIRKCALASTVTIMRFFGRVNEYNLHDEEDLLGLESGFKRVPNQQASKDLAEKCFADTVNKVKVARAAEAKAESRRKEDEERRDRDLTAASPTILMKDFVENLVDEKAKKTEDVNMDNEVDDVATAEEVGKKAVEALAKNGARAGPQTAGRRPPAKLLGKARASSMSWRARGAASSPDPIEVSPGKGGGGASSWHGGKGSGGRKGRRRV